MSTSGTHNPPEFKHAEDMEWEMGRFGNVNKFLFHPRRERPTEPNAGFLKYAPGASFPLHRHDFAQVWYITPITTRGTSRGRNSRGTSV